MKRSKSIGAKVDVIRADFRRRIEMVHTFNEHRKCADFVLIYNMAWYLVNEIDYYANTNMATALEDCKAALMLFDAEKSNNGDVSAGTLIRVAVTLTPLAEMVLSVNLKHYCRAADAAYDFSQRSYANAQQKSLGANSHKPSQAKRKLCRRVDAARCRRSTRRELGRAIADSRCNNQSSAGSA